MINGGPTEKQYNLRLKLSFFLFMGVLAIGTVGFKYFAGPERSLVDCLYMTVISVTTVGYGEIIDLSSHPGGRVFTMLLIFAGMGIILYFVSNATAFLIDGNLREIFWRRKMQNKIDAMRGHYIVCGVGTMGMHIIDEMLSTERLAVAVDTNHDRLVDKARSHPKLGVITGDAAENDVLERAGIARAGGIVICTDSDKDNLVITITARQMNPNLRIVARCADIKHTEKFRLAGADSVISSNYIGGLRMASEMMRPTVVSFLDMMMRGKDAMRIEEVPVGERLRGRPVSEVKAQVLTLAVCTPEGEYLFNPPDTHLMSEGSTVIFMGTPEQRRALL